MTKTHCMLEHTDIGPESEHGCTQLLFLVTMDYILAVKAATATFTTYRKLALISLYISQASCGICYKMHKRIELNMIQCSKSSGIIKCTNDSLGAFQIHDSYNLLSTLQLLLYLFILHIVAIKTIYTVRSNTVNSLKSF